tara:strand:+ start:261 stop:698 length:438 start_codon:yes stop_codon:yes gene_type:complete
MSEDTFYRDLAGGKKVEAKHLTLIQKTYPDAVEIEGYCKEWDIFIPSKGFGVEVKSDKMSQKTGNIVVEVMYHEKPSALSTTKSRYWIFDTGVKTIHVETDTLRKLIDNSKDRYREWTARGDKYLKKGYFIRQDVMEGIGIDSPW